MVILNIDCKAYDNDFNFNISRSDMDNDSRKCMGYMDSR